jgi:hypothetical protein
MGNPVRRLMGTLAVLLTCALMSVINATPAAAISANANVYAVAPSANWCPGWLNKVTWVQWANHTTGGTSGDGGDDVVWMPVRTGYSNSVTISVRCKYSTPIGMNFTIRPSRNGQTFWFYPNGGYGSN